MQKLIYNFLTLVIIH